MNNDSSDESDSDSYVDPSQETVTDSGGDISRSASSGLSSRGHFSFGSVSYQSLDSSIETVQDSTTDCSGIVDSS